MDKLQLIFFFITGFLVSRLFIKVQLPERMVFSLLGGRSNSFPKVIFYLISISALLSFFIPNVITVLTLLPILELLRRAYAEAEEGSAIGSISTILALATIYGANIGGMGSVTATPANGILVTYTELNNVVGTGAITFAGWMSWGIPLVILLVAAAWLVLMAIFRPWRYKNTELKLPFELEAISHPWQRLTVMIAVGYFTSSLLLSALIMKYSAYTLEIIVLTGVLTLAFALFLFFYPLPLASAKQPMLMIADCYSNLPTRGFLFVGIAIVLAGLIYLSGLDKLFSAWISDNFPRELPLYLMFILLALMTSFATEILSNTAVQIGLFLIILPLSATMGFDAMLAMLIITLSSTSAFMSPIATGVNGLAFGGVKDVSITKMLVSGFVMNSVGALIISMWVIYVVSVFTG